MSELQLFRDYIQSETWRLGPYAGIDCNLTLCRLQHMYHRQPYSKADLNPMPQSTLFPCQRLRLGL